MKRYKLLLIQATWVWTCTLFNACPQPVDVQQWEADIRHFEHLDSTEVYTNQAILFVGSSSIRLWSTLAGDMAPYEVIQRGYGGAKLSDLVVYADRIIYPHPCRAIVIFVANDITGVETDISPAEVAVLANRVFQIIRDQMSEVPIFYIATTPTPLRWEAWPRISEANERIRELCMQDDHAFFIDTSDAYLDADGMPLTELFVEDRLHLNEEGYRIWTGIIRNSLRQVIGE